MKFYLEENFISMALVFLLGCSRTNFEIAALSRWCLFLLAMRYGNFSGLFGTTANQSWCINVLLWSCIVDNPSSGYMTAIRVVFRVSIVPLAHNNFSCALVFHKFVNIVNHVTIVLLLVSTVAGIVKRPWNWLFYLYDFSKGCRQVMILFN